MNKIKKYFIIMVVLVGLSLFLNLGYTLAKYVNNQYWDYYFNAKDFYFYSDNLNGDSEEIIDKYWDLQNIHFNIKNNQNDLLVTEYDIDYEVECLVLGEASSHAKCVLNGSNNNKTTGKLSALFKCVNYTRDGIKVDQYSQSECETNNYSWQAVPTKSEHFFNIEITDDEYELGQIVTEITLTSIAPYKKTLKGTYVLTNNLINDVVKIKYHDLDNFGNLIITNEKNQKEIVEIEFDSEELTLDINQEIISYFLTENELINKIYLEVSSRSSVNVLFLKKNKLLNIDASNFSYKTISEEEYNNIKS